MKYDLKNSIKSLVITIIIVFVGVIKNEFVCIKEYDTSKVVNNNIKDNYIKVDTLAFEANEYSLEDDIKFFVYENYDLFKFYSDTFSISMEDIINELINSNVEVFNYKDIGNTGTEYESLDKNIIDYLFDLEKNKPKLFDNKLVSNTNSNEYI